MFEPMRRVPASVFALSFGVLSLLAFLMLAYLVRYWLPLSGFILHAFASAGLVNTAPSYIVELKPRTFFSFDDENFVLWCQIFAFVLSVLGTGFALRSEYNGEPTTYSSAGFILATLGIWLLYPLIGLGVQLTGALVLFGIRRAGAVQT